MSERSERARVGEHVRRVGEQRERVGEDAGDDLADHERDDQREPDPEPARIGVGADDDVRVAGVRVARRASARRGRACSSVRAYPRSHATRAGARRAGRTMPRVILDGHNDLVLRRWRGETPKHIDLARPREAGVPRRVLRAVTSRRRTATPTSRRPRRTRCRSRSRSLARRRDASPSELADVLEGLGIPLARRVDDFQPGRVTAIMHLEGADPLAPDLSDLDALVRPRAPLARDRLVAAERVRGGRAVPVPGLARHRPGADRRRAGASCAPATGSGILVDLSHLNEAGFWDVARAPIAPLVATHSNAHALCASTRNLTDAQLDAIGDSGGVVGVNFASASCARTARVEPATPIAEIVRHVDYIAERIGVDHVAFGSDFEGATVPDELGGVDGLPRLVDGAARAAATTTRRVAKITHGNWLRVLGETWRPLGPLLRHRRRRPARDAARRARPLRRAGPRGRPRRRHGARHGRAAAPRLERGRDRRRAGGDRPAARARRAGDSPRLETRVARFEDARWPTCDLVNASFALPFCPPGASASSGRGSSTRSGRRPLLRPALRRPRRVGRHRHRRADPRRGRAAARAVRGRAARGGRRGRTRP